MSLPPWSCSTVVLRSCTTTSHQSTTGQHHPIDKGEADRFAKFANHWWDKSGPLEALHAMNRLRVPFITNALNPDSVDSQGIVGSKYLPLHKKHILDVGCGGGILSEPLARLGARVVAIDQVHDSLEAARIHSESAQWPTDCTRPDYQLVDLGQLAGSDSRFDAVVLSEVIEHVPGWPSLLKTASQCLKPSGYLFVTTINQTCLSWLFGILVAEYVLRLVPRGTHQWERFIEPSRLEVECIKIGLNPRSLVGMAYNPLTGRWSWTSNMSISYAFCAQKDSSAK